MTIKGEDRGEESTQLRKLGSLKKKFDKYLEDNTEECNEMEKRGRNMGESPSSQSYR